LAWYKKVTKPNTTEAKHEFTNHKKYTATEKN